MELHIELISCVVVSLDVTIKKSSLYIRSTDSVFWHILMWVFKKINDTEGKKSTFKSRNKMNATSNARFDLFYSDNRVYTKFIRMPHARVSQFLIEIYTIAKFATLG